MRILMFAGWLIGAAIAGSGLYGIAYEVERLAAGLDSIEQDIRREREATRTLEAEWAYLARPDRIAELSRRYLPDMRGLSADRLARIEDLPLGAADDETDTLSPAGPATPASALAPQHRVTP